MERAIKDFRVINLSYVPFWRSLEIGELLM